MNQKQSAAGLVGQEESAFGFQFQLGCSVPKTVENGDLHHMHS